MTSGPSRCWTTPAHETDVTSALPVIFVHSVVEYRVEMLNRRWRWLLVSIACLGLWMCSPGPSRDRSSPFEGFDNETGSDHFLSPNVIHYIRFNQSQYSFTDYVAFRSAWINHRPDLFYIHTNVDGFHGRYWDLIQQDAEWSSRIRLVPTEAPHEIFGQPLRAEWRLFHGSDLTRIWLMMRHGGIYLDNDVYVIRNLDKYRKFELAIAWDQGQFIGTQVVIGHKSARFLPLWLDTYRDNYRPDLWYYNAGERPTVEVLHRHPELVHRVKIQFGADTNTSWRLYTDPQFEWRRLDTIHLLVNHRSYMDPYYNDTPEFNEENILKYPYPFGQLAREVLDL